MGNTPTDLGALGFSLVRHRLLSDLRQQAAERALNLLVSSDLSVDDLIAGQPAPVLSEAASILRGHEAA